VAGAEVGDGGGSVLLVDAANVVGSRPTGWWRDRAGAARRFVDRVRAAVANGALDPPVVVVLEGAARRGVDEGTAGGVEVVHAPGEGDDTLARLAEDAGAAAAGGGGGRAVTLVSADRGLGERVRRTGAGVVGPRWLLDRLPPDDP
jgi:hypothetical protein